MGLIRAVKKIFGKYDLGYEYWVYTKDIKVPEAYKKSRIREEKWQRKLDYWWETGEFESPILLDHDFNLIDGYSSVKIAYLNDIQKVPVHFVGSDCR